MSDPTPCWSYGPDASRCEATAGHAGDHLRTVTWTDEQAWTPQAAPAPATPALPGRVPPVPMPTVPPTPALAGACPKCKHPATDHIDGACTRLDCRRCSPGLLGG